jgi:hypothetical protein
MELSSISGITGEKNGRTSMMILDLYDEIQNRGLGREYQHCRSVRHDV